MNKQVKKHSPRYQVILEIPLVMKGMKTGRLQLTELSIFWILAYVTDGHRSAEHLRLDLAKSDSARRRSVIQGCR